MHFCIVQFECGVVCMHFYIVQFESEPPGVPGGMPQGVPGSPPKRVPVLIWPGSCQETHPKATFCDSFEGLSKLDFSWFWSYVTRKHQETPGCPGGPGSHRKPQDATGCPHGVILNLFKPGNATYSLNLGSFVCIFTSYNLNLVSFSDHLNAFLHRTI